MLNQKVQLIVGLWLIISPWLLGFASASPMKWSSVIAGTIVFLMNLWEIFGPPPSSN